MTHPVAVHGVCPVLETPFTADGSVDFESFDRLIEHLLHIGVRQVMYPGYASEYLKLRESERAQLTQRLITKFHATPGATVVISVPDHSREIAVENARHAVASGADMINILPPHLLAPSGENVLSHIRAILAAIGSTPAILQYAPAQTGTALDASTIAALAQEFPNLVQVKVESAPPGRLISALSATEPALGSVVGHAGVQLIDALRRGANGVQPGCSFSEIYLEIWNLWEQGKTAAAFDLHGRLLPFISYWMNEVELVISAEKRISALRGLIATDYCRAPVRELDEEEIAMIDRFLTEFEDFWPEVGAQHAVEESK